MHHEGDLLSTTQVLTVTVEDEKASKDSKAPSVAEVTAELVHEDFIEIVEQADPVDVKKAFWWSAVIIIIISVIIPIPLGSASYVYSPGFFTAWMVVAMVSLSNNSLKKVYLTNFMKIWSFCAGFACIILPIWESRAALKHVVFGLIALAQGKRIAPLVAEK